MACAIAAPIACRHRRVESVDRRVSDEAAARFFSGRETAGARRASTRAIRRRRFFELWTLKEAHVKAVGAGLSHPLNTIVFSVGEERAIAFDPPPGVDAACWQFALFATRRRTCWRIAVRRTRTRDGRVDHARDPESLPVTAVLATRPLSQFARFGRRS